MFTCKLEPSARNLTLLAVALLAAATVLTGCSEVNPASPLALLDASGNHPQGWAVVHGSYAFPDGAICTECHGDNLDGGISGVSCSTDSFNGQACHANGPAFHPPQWLDKNAVGFHGDAYASGSSLCALCHDPGNPTTPPGYNCLDCHFSQDGTQRVPSGSGYSHGDSTTAHQQFLGTADGDVCIACHQINAGFGYQPTCHNCHAVHPAGWSDRTVHGASAMANPGAALGFDYCRSCHGDDFTGGSAGVSCLQPGACHNAASPHTGSWRSRHDNTDRDNGSICGLCHLGDRTPPTYQAPPAGSCLNNTLCHGFKD